MKVVCDTNVLVSGDHHLLALGMWRGIHLLTPADFLRLLDAHAR